MERNMERSKSMSRTFDASGHGESSSDLEHEHEIRELKMKIRHLENQLTESKTDFARRSNQSSAIDQTAEMERLRSSQQQAERMLDNREQSHRQQVMKLENQVKDIVFCLI
jgi:capsule polysaccharide export protein KpsE/RkpR